jgi:hypothetical protein
MFQYRLWPEGLEFPSCEACNHGTNDDDLLISMLARMDPSEKKGNRDGRVEGLMKAVNKQNPHLFSKMMPSVREARRQLRTLGLKRKSGQTYQESAAVKVPDEIHGAVCVVATKLAKGIFYRTTARIFPEEGCLLLNWFTNVDLLRTGKYPVFDLVKHLAGDVPPLKRSETFLNDQFEYKLSLSPNRDILVLQAIFGNAFGLIIFGSAVPNLLENIVTRLREQTSREGPFAVLQSLSLKSVNAKAA